MTPSRGLAFEVLRRVEAGGHASDLLAAGARNLPAREASLAQEITLGSLRRQNQLDYLIGHYSGRDPLRLDREVRIALRMGIYQIRYLDRVPPHAAVSESVELTRRAHKRSAAGLVNAVLRKVNRDEIRWPDRSLDLATPEWMLDRWERRFGRQTAEGLARAFLQPPQRFLEPTTGRIQDIGAQSVVPLLDLRPGLTLLDLCAAPGNKTAQALAAGARVVACDRSLARLRLLDRLACPRVALDATVSLPFHTRFDRILVDAPCSGTGTLAPNPEIKWRLRPPDLALHHARQVKILRSALQRLAPGGRLVYSTCSLEPEENEAVLEEVLGTVPETARYRLPGQEPGDGFFTAVLGPAGGEAAS